MSTVVAIALKDIRIGFATWTNYVLAAVALLLLTHFFQGILVDFQLQLLEMKGSEAVESMNLTDWVMAPLLYNAAFLLVFLAPVLTMRALVDERQNGTLAWLHTLPLTSWQLILGKYAGLLVVGLLLLTLTLVFPASFWWLESEAGSGPVLDLATVASGYLGLAFTLAAFLALGLAVSAATESSVVAGVLGFALLLFLFVLAGRVGDEVQWLAQLGEALSASNHLRPFLTGSIRLQDFVYFMSLIVFGLAFAQRMVDGDRWA